MLMFVEKKKTPQKGVTIKGLLVLTLLERFGHCQRFARQK